MREDFKNTITIYKQNLTTYQHLPTVKKESLRIVLVCNVSSQKTLRSNENAKK